VREKTTVDNHNSLKKCHTGRLKLTKNYIQIWRNGYGNTGDQGKTRKGCERKHGGSVVKKKMQGRQEEKNC